MTTTNITNFRKNAFNYVEQTIKYNEPLNISTKDGDAVLLSAEDYSGWTNVWTKMQWSGKCIKSSTPKQRRRMFRS